MPLASDVKLQIITEYGSSPTVAQAIPAASLSELGSASLLSQGFMSRMMIAGQRGFEEWESVSKIASQCRRGSRGS